MYIDLKEYDVSEAALREGIKICDEHPDLIAYQRKKHDLHRYLLDVYLEDGNYQKAGQTVVVLDEGSRKNHFPDTVSPDIRKLFDYSL